LLIKKPVPWPRIFPSALKVRITTIEGSIFFIRAGKFSWPIVEEVPVTKKRKKKLAAKLRNFAISIPGEANRCLKAYFIIATKKESGPKTIRSRESVLTHDPRREPFTSVYKRGEGGSLPDKGMIERG
jgi:hypothetical protein